jgi:hypothetical protein
MKSGEEDEKKERTWLPTKVENLYRHKKGTYYGRFKIAGKKKWVALRTTVFTTAKLRLTDEAKKIAELRASGVTADAANLTFANLIKTYLDRVDADSGISAKTKQGRHDGVNRVLKTRPKFASLSPARLAPATVAEWSHRLRTNEEFSRPGAKTVHCGFSADAVNKAVASKKEQGSGFGVGYSPNAAPFWSPAPSATRSPSGLPRKGCPSSNVRPASGL